MNVNVTSAERPRWKSQANSEFFPNAGMVFTMPSLTVPDMNMTVREIVERFASGRTADVAQSPVFSDGELPDLSRLDKVQTTEYLKTLTNELRDITKRVSDARSLKLAKKEQDKFDAAVKAAVEAAVAANPIVDVK